MEPKPPRDETLVVELTPRVAVGETVKPRPVVVE